METPPPIDTPLLAASAIILGILLSSLVLRYRRLKRRRDSILPSACLHSWNIGWVNFGLFICGFDPCVTLFQTAGGLIQEQITDIKVSLYAMARCLCCAPAASSALNRLLPQSALFFTNTACQINFKPFSLRQGIQTTLPVFIRFLPLIWLASLLWTHILEDLQGFGLINEAPPQELVQLFQSGGIR